jgi:hypothetical protein
MNCLVCDKPLDHKYFSLQICKECKEKDGIEWNYQ